MDVRKDKKMMELDEYTSLWLAEWEQKRDYFDDCTGITDYEKT